MSFRFLSSHNLAIKNCICNCDSGKYIVFSVNRLYFNSLMFRSRKSNKEFAFNLVFLAIKSKSKVIFKNIYNDQKI